ncbi:tRNA-guanine(15) transglycosylase-like protein [Infundibulicybe gibba]|nr:tRNA-guanine(15) transglycosylase-like protein [Infundibulicybe gibba]
MSSLNFILASPVSSKFGPRLGSLIIQRPNHPDQKIATPGLLASTSRGVIPHLSRDHYAATSSVQWVHVPFESFVELTPPIPTLQQGKNPLHMFLGFSPSQHVLSMSIRDPSDEREMPPNSSAHISAYCLRGVRKVSPEQWRTYVLACKPDIAFALTDTPYTNPPYSQKRLTKSIERSLRGWLIFYDHFRQRNAPRDEAALPARRAFSQSLLEVLFGKDSEAIAPLRHLDEGVSGYVFDLAPLRHTLSLLNPRTNSPKYPCRHPNRALPRLPIASEILRLIQTVGIDIFDARFAQRAADLGVALDFEFPAPPAGERITHCSLTDPSNIAKDLSTDKEGQPSSKPSYTRAYIHHLLHTHEMSAHTLLATHNSPRSQISSPPFASFYPTKTLNVLNEATTTWKEVELARGKGRLRREKEKEERLH